MSILSLRASSKENTTVNNHLFNKPNIGVLNGKLQGKVDFHILDKLNVILKDIIWYCIVIRLAFVREYLILNSIHSLKESNSHKANLISSSNISANNPVINCFFLIVYSIWRK